MWRIKREGKLEELKHECVCSIAVRVCMHTPMLLGPALFWLGVCFVTGWPCSSPGCLLCVSSNPCPVFSHSKGSECYAGHHELLKL